MFSTLTLRTQLALALGALIVACVVIWLLLPQLALPAWAAALAVGIGCFAAGIWVAMRAMRPVRQLSAGLRAEKPEVGNDPAFHELNELRHSVLGLIRKFESQLHELLTANRALESRVVKRTQDFNLLADIAAGGALRPDEGSLLSLTLQELQRSVNYAIASIWIRRQGNIVLAKVLVREQDGVPFEIPRNQELPASLAQTYEEMERDPKPMVFNQVRRNLLRWLIEQLLQSRVAELLGATRSWAAVPLLVEGRMIGLLRLDHADDHYFTDEHVRLLSAVASPVALALEYARLHTYAEQMAVMAERSRIARDLHDAVSQTLFATSVTASTLEKTWARDPEKDRSSLRELRQLAQSAQDEMRLMLFELRPDAFQNTGISTLLRQLASASASRSHFKVEVNIDDRVSLEPAQKENVYRIVQEALNNVARHSQAAHAEIALALRGEWTVLQIIDDGKGVDPNKPVDGRLGMTSMRERAQELGAEFDVRSTAGAGTTIEIKWKSK